MKDDLERVLEGLGRVDVPAGLEGRVLRAMAAREETRRGFGWAWAGVVALVLIGILVGGWEREWRRPVEVAAAPGIAIQPPRVGEPGSVVVPATVAARRLSPRPPTITTPLRVAVIRGHPSDVLAPAEVAKAGFPAAAAPLTDQERLLLRLARHANSGTLAMFDPRIREERAAEEKAEFEFFNPQPAVMTAEPEEAEHAVQGKQ